MQPGRPRWTLRSLAVAALCLVSLAACSTTPPPSQCEPFMGLDPTCQINRPLLKEAVQSYKSHYNKISVGQKVVLTESGVPIPFVQHWLRTDKFVVIDFTKPAYEKRLFVVDWKTGQVEAFHVSHGRGSAANERSYHAKRFTNLIGSGTSSVGAFVAGQEYLSPKWGRAMRLQGLDITNSRALERTIVFHADEMFFDKHRNIFGWSCGCFMMDGSDLPGLLSTMENGGFVYAGPISLFDRTTVTKTRECNDFCGDQDLCPVRAGINPIGSLPGLAPPAQRPDAVPYSVVPNPNPGEVPVPSQKPPGIAIPVAAEPSPPAAG